MKTSIENTFKFFAFITLLVICTKVTAETMPKTIVVIGNGIEQVVPDSFEITVVLEEKGPTVTKLNEAIQFRMKEIVSFLLNEGIEEKNIQSLNINLYPQYENTSKGRREVGVVLSRQIKISSQNLDKYDTLIDGLLMRGIERIAHFGFVKLQQEKYKERALISAIKDAEHKAELMASELGMKVIGVQNISQYGASTPTGINSARMMAESRSSALPGTTSLSAKVQVAFIIAEK